MSTSRPLQEADLVPTRRLLLVSAGVILLTIGCLVWVALVMRPFESGRGGVAPFHATPAAEIGGRRATAIEQRLFNEGPGRAELLHVGQRARLDSYGEVDRARGLVRIPIERAMELVASGKASSLEKQP